MITIYKTPKCAYCAQTTRYLDTKRVNYQVIDVTETPSKEYEDLAQLYGSSVPLVTDGKSGYVGWNMRELNRMAGLNG
jgi:glutaredoxin